MNKTDTALARRALLEHWLLIFRDTIANQRSETERLLCEANGEPITPPPLIITTPSSDMTKLLLSGIESALVGNEDPFMIRPPGKAPMMPRQKRIEMVAELIAEIEKRKVGGTRAYRRISIDFVAGRRGIPPDTLEAYLKDKDILGMAKLVPYQKTQTKSGNRK
jgi:hypothetical protein